MNIPDHSHETSSDAGSDGGDNFPKVVTLADVARATGFSQMTVSNALRDKPKVSEENRRKIKRIAAEMGYRANAAATMLRNNRSGIIQIVIDDFEVPFHASIAKYLAQATAEHHYQVAVRQSSRSEYAEVRVLRSEPGLVYDGIILDAPNVTEEQALHHANGKPAMVIGDDTTFSVIDSMGTACARGAASAAEHLWDRGCREFYVFGAPPASDRDRPDAGGSDHVDSRPSARRWPVT